MAKVNTEFFIALGDNFYNDGVPDLSTNRFDETWSRVYNAPTFMKPWHLLAGNHDHKGNVTAQIDYSRVNSRWNFPAPYYVINKKFADKAGNGVTVDIVMIDTVLLAGSWDHHEPQVSRLCRVVAELPAHAQRSRCSSRNWSPTQTISGRSFATPSPTRAPTGFSWPGEHCLSLSL